MNIEQARLLATDETTTPEILAELARHEDYEIRQCVAANPNTPTEVLLSICVEFPQEVINNPIVPLLILENPLIFTCDRKLDFDLIRYSINRELDNLGWNREQQKDYLSEIYDCRWIDYLSKEQLLNLLSRLKRLKSDNYTCPIFLKIEQAGRLANKEISESEILSELEKNPNKLTCKYILHNPNVSAEAIEKIYNSWGFTWSIAKHPKTGALTLQRLVNENRTNKKLLKVVAIHPNNSPSNFKSLLDICPLQVIKNSAIEFVLLEQPNFFDDVIHLPKKFFNNKNIPLWFFELAANHPHINIRAEVAIGNKTPLHILEKLSEDRELKVRNYIYWNKNTPNSIINKLKQETIEYAPFKNY